MPYQDIIRDILKTHGLVDATELAAATLELLRLFHAEAALQSHRGQGRSLPLQLRDAARAEAELRRLDAHAHEPGSRGHNQRIAQAAGLTALADLLDYFIPVWDADLSQGMRRLRDAIKRRGGPPTEPPPPQSAKPPAQEMTGRNKQAE
jgi:hypothetical protein